MNTIDPIHQEAIDSYRAAQISELGLAPENIHLAPEPDSATAPFLVYDGNERTTSFVVAALNYAHALKLAHLLRTNPATVEIDGAEYSVSATPVMETESFESATRIYRRTVIMRYDISKLEFSTS